MVDGVDISDELEDEAGFEIYFTDLTAAAQRNLLKCFKTKEEDENWDVYPVAVIYRSILNSLRFKPIRRK